MEEKSALTRWIYLAIGVIVLLFDGIIYAWSILKVPLAAEFGWTIDELAINYTLTMSFFCLGGIAGGIFSRKTGIRFLLLISSIMVCIGFMLTASLSGQNIGMLYFSYSMLDGFGIGMAYNLIITTISAWFPDKKGICTGCMMMGFGASALLLGNVADAFFQNPNVGWRKTFMGIGVALGIVLLVAAIFIHLPEEKKLLDIINETDEKRVKNYTPWEMLHQGSFWKVFIYNVFLVAVGSTVISFAKDLSLSVGASAVLSTTLVGILSICNSLGRIFSGILFDKIGQKRTMMMANLITIGAAGVVLSAVFCNSLMLCIAGLCITGVSYGSCPTVASAFTASFYGMKYYSVNFSIMGFNIMFGSLIATVANMLYSSTNTYLAPMCLLLALSVVALFINLNINTSK